MTKYLITVSTNWTGTDNTYALITDKSMQEIERLAQDLAFENFMESGCEYNILEENFPNANFEDLTEAEEDLFNDIIDESYGYEINEVTDNDLETFNLYERVIL